MLGGIIASLGQFISGSPIMHKVVSGDTVSQLAQKFGTSTQAIQGMNPAMTDVDKIGVGQNLRVGKTGGLLARAFKGMKSKMHQRMDPGEKPSWYEGFALSPQQQSYMAQMSNKNGKIDEDADVEDEPPDRRWTNREGNSNPFDVQASPESGITSNVEVADAPPSYRGFGGGQGGRFY